MKLLKVSSVHEEQQIQNRSWKRSCEENDDRENLDGAMDDTELDHSERGLLEILLLAVLINILGSYSGLHN